MKEEKRRPESEKAPDRDKAPDTGKTTDIEKTSDNRKKPDLVYYFVNAIAITVFLVSAGIYFYPILSNLWNQYRNDQLMVEYHGTVEELRDEEKEQILAEARAYNEQHTVNVIEDVFGEGAEEYVLTHPYDTLLNPTGNEIMGSLEIPCIDLQLAIYHGVGTESLERGVGHIEGTSLPIGGINTHAVLSAHRGLPRAKLFTDLDQIVVGDQFFIYVLNDVLAYEVDQILTVLPSELDALAIEEGQDLVTLVTCTPYAVNTHRLLVRGHRVPYEKVNTDIEPRETGVKKDWTLVLMIVTGILSLILILILRKRIRERKKEKEQIKELLLLLEREEERKKAAKKR